MCVGGTLGRNNADWVRQERQVGDKRLQQLGDMHITFTPHPLHLSLTSHYVCSRLYVPIRPHRPSLSAPGDVFGTGVASVSCSAGLYPGVKKNFGSTHTCFNLSHLCPLPCEISWQVIITCLSTGKLFIATSTGYEANGERQSIIITRVIFQNVLCCVFYQSPIVQHCVVLITF